MPLLYREEEDFSVLKRRECLPHIYIYICIYIEREEADSFLLERKGCPAFSSVQIGDRLLLYEEEGVSRSYIGMRQTPPL